MKKPTKCSGVNGKHCRNQGEKKYMHGGGVNSKAIRFFCKDCHSIVKSQQKDAA